jgi:hypothetical protein
MTREVMQQALEALVTAEAGLADIGDADREPTDDLAWCEERAVQALAKPRAAIVALKAALAQPEQEPVAWQWLDTATFRKKIPPTGESECWNPLYTAPPQRQPLPHEQAKALVTKYGNDPLNLVFQTEAAHGIGENT